MLLSLIIEGSLVCENSIISVEKVSCLLEMQILSSYSTIVIGVALLLFVLIL